jgi:retron-type reverse transcriptase
MKKYREKHRDKLNEYSKNWRYENEDKMKEQRKLYYQENKEDIVKKNYEYCKNRKKSDSLYKLSIGIRSLILISFKNQFTTKSKKTTEILDCSFEEFKLHLESQFDDKMNWENQGTYGSYNTYIVC